MKNKFWLLVVIALVVVIGFTTASCGDDDNGTKTGGGKAEPTVNWPSGFTAMAGDLLSTITLPADNGAGTEGAFAWATPTVVVGDVGLRLHRMIFTPADTAIYNTKTQNINIRVCPEDMVWIEAGSFVMGSPASETDMLGSGWFDNERPRTANGGVVTMSGFYMGKFPVTQAQYVAVMNVANPSHFNTNTALPVEMVSWYDAVEFCNRLSILENLSPAYSLGGKTNPDEWEAKGLAWIGIQIVSGSNGYRLPTEAQWEYACRAGTTTPFSWGNSINETQANYEASFVDAYNLVAGTNKNTTTVQGTYEPNAWGLYDMHGNVFEWCWDRHTFSYNDAGGSDNPSGLASENFGRVIRGGWWNLNGRFLRSAFRDGKHLSGMHNYVGFRLVRP